MLWLLCCDESTAAIATTGFMKFLPKKVLIHNWSSWKRVEEVNLERARYLLNTNELLEEMNKYGQKN